MKATLYDMKGKEKGSVEMPKVFNQKIREDLVKKYFEVFKMIQPYSTDPKAGRKHSASGTISHKRHDWKGHYGQGRSRVPRKTMWRRGVNFFWIGAEVSGTRGGRRVHGPKGIGKEKKMNKKEIKVAMNSAFAATGDAGRIIERYDRIEKVNFKAPVVIESKLENTKVKELLGMFKEIFGNADLILKKKKVRPGKGKMRGRKYKSNAGLLLVKGNDEKIKFSGVDVRNVSEVSISDLYPLGRLTVYTEKAISEMKNEGGKSK